MVLTIAANTSQQQQPTATSSNQQQPNVDLSNYKKLRSDRLLIFGFI